MLSTVSDGDLRCSVCNVDHPNLRSLFRHLRLHFDNNKDFLKKCYYCDFVFTGKDDIAQHLLTEHEVDIDFGDVQESTSRETSDIAAMECEFCSDSFKNYEALRLHVIRKHKLQSSGSKLSVNDDCSSSTNDNNSSIAAFQTCSYKHCKCHCGKTFLRISDYRQHVSQYHKIDLDYFEQECGDLHAFEKFKVECRLKYDLVFVNEMYLDQKFPVFKCDEDDELNGTCAAKLSVFRMSNKFLISGVITHTNHRYKPYVAKQVSHCEATSLVKPISNLDQIPCSSKMQHSGILNKDVLLVSTNPINESNLSSNLPDDSLKISEQQPAKQDNSFLTRPEILKPVPSSKQLNDKMPKKKRKTTLDMIFGKTKLPDNKKLTLDLFSL